MNGIIRQIATNQFQPNTGGIPAGGGAGSNMPFTLSRNTVNVAFTGATGQFVSTTARSILGGDAYDAKISYDGVSAALPQATNYTETLTFTISAP